MVVVLFTMMVSTQVSHANTMDVCVKHCVPNQCMKVAKKATIPLCENACKKLCNENQFAQEKYIVNPPPNSYCNRFFGVFCNK